MTKVSIKIARDFKSFSHHQGSPELPFCWESYEFKSRDMEDLSGKIKVKIVKFFADHNLFPDHIDFIRSLEGQRTRGATHPKGSLYFSLRFQQTDSEKVEDLGRQLANHLKDLAKPAKKPRPEPSSP